MKIIRLGCVCAFLALSCIRSNADVITEWNALLLDAIRNEATSPPLAARNLAIFHAAVYDAVNSVERTHEPYFISLSSTPGTSAEAAAVGAAYECLADLYPSQLASFDAALNQFLSNTPPTAAREDGLILGEMAALILLNWRSADGSSTTVPYIPGTEPGNWRRTPPFFRPPELPQWPYVTPFALTNAAQFRPPGPPSLTSTQYTRDFNLVQDLGAINSTNRTAEQTLIARFWSDFSYTVTPPGHWNQIAQNVATNRTSTLAQNARLFALLNIAMADAGIASWDAKYVYNFWRPVTAIREGDTDDNPDTTADSSWTPLLTTPAFPEYISGHSTFSAAAASVLAAFYETDHVSFTVGSDTLPGILRSYDSFEFVAEEIGLSRIYGGIHFLSADLDGLSVGRQIGEYVFQNQLQTIPNRPTLAITANPTYLGISVTGTAGNPYVLQVSTNLLQWTPILTNTAPFAFEDAAASAAARFYRAVAQ